MLAPVPTFAAIITVVAVGYALGSLPIANRVARRHGVADLRTDGDRNPGYWNARLLLGVRAAAPVFVFDIAKGASGAAVGVLLADSGQWWLPYIGGAAAMVGHAWPVFAGFRGGRSVLAFVGAAAVFAPMPALLAVGLLFAAWLASRRFDWAARIGIAVFPVFQIIIEGPERTALTGALMTLIGLRFLQAKLGDQSGNVPGA